MKDLNIETLLRDYARKRKEGNLLSQGQEEIDFELVSRYIEGATTAEENRIVEQLRQKDKTLDKLLADTSTLSSVPAEHPPVRDDEPSFDSPPSEERTHVIRLPKSWVPVALRWAACLVLMVSGAFVVTTIICPHARKSTPPEKPRAVVTSPPQMVLRGIRPRPTATATNETCCTNSHSKAMQGE